MRTVVLFVPMRGELTVQEMGDTCARKTRNAYGISSLVGALFVFVFLSYIAPNEHIDRGGSVLIDIALFAGYFIVVAAVGGGIGERLAKRAMGWVPEGRRPTDEERRLTLSLALRLAQMSFIPWIGAAVFFGVINAVAGHDFWHILTVTAVTLDGGLVSCTVGFLLGERAMRPIVAIALQGADPPTRMRGGVKTRLLLTWLLGSAVPFMGLALLPIAARHANQRTDIGGAVVVLSCAGLLAGGLITVAAAKAVAEPLRAVMAALEAVRQGRLDVRVPVDGAGDLGVLEAGVNRMVEGLRERARLEDLFGRHVGAEVAQRALAQGSGLDSEQRDASALFVDIIGSTPMAEVLPPGDVVATLNAFFSCVVDVVGDEGGWVNKFEGDGALCVFGAPANQTDHAARALRAARRLRAEIAELRSAHPGLDVAIGVSSGVLVAGNVGTEARYEYTVIGRPVNEAARLTDVAKGRASHVLASSGALDRAGDEASRWSSAGTVALRGQSTPTEIFEPLEVRAPIRA
jgi:adenylate cyclase